ncbi:AraC family transcriptional regulator [Altererythrobacter sp. B11]|uniref:AraC family transcriptional regulator n=1 Tax=Altererythrobacter sp. B11 TaxID=2060312 RepID=UPI000DC6EAD7|nr:AraC family transcriptional regulator [Altererythrobacter sp. B11]BBC74372.1 AraC family transcriptional regulator [Altererythrobacter sp. B11]
MDRMAQLAEVITRYAPAAGMHRTAVPRLSLFRADEPTVPTPSVYDASLCLIAQGAKSVAIAEQELFYDAAHYLVVSVDLPLVGRVTEASADAPYLCCKIDLDLPALVDMVIAEGGPGKPPPAPALAVYPGDPDLIDAACRLVRLLDRPESIPALAPLIERELLYRLLAGPHGGALRHLAVADSRLGQVSRAVARIRDRFRDQLRIRDIAAAAGMSESSLHEHFKAVTRTTPLEYQKQLRLQEARRLMLAKGLSAGAAGFAVGYDSPSQFSREYRRLFGAPPRQDVDRLSHQQNFLGAV